MKRATLKKHLATLLGDSADKFQPLDLDLLLDLAAIDLTRVKPRVVSATVTLTADESFYAAPSDMVKPIILDWGAADLLSKKPWNADWPGRLPRLTSLNIDGVKKLMLAPAPTQAQINLLGTEAAYRYAARYTIGDTDAETNITEDDEPLLLTRALAEAMLALAARGIAKPVTLGGRAAVSVPRNGTPAALAQQLMDHFEGMAR